MDDDSPNSIVVRATSNQVCIIVQVNYDHDHDNHEAPNQLAINVSRLESEL